MNTNDYNLFSAADAVLAPFITQFDFERSLLFNILFQDKLLLHESYFFGSNFIANHIKDSIHPISLFEKAAQQGIIIPAYREEKVKTLEESYNHMKTVYGKDYNFIDENHNDATIYRLYDALNRGLLIEAPFYWPKDTQLGVTYYKTTNALLNKEELPEYLIEDSKRYSSLFNYWKSSKKWRTELIELAAERTLEKGSPGLQRNEIFNLLGKDIGIPNSTSINWGNLKKYSSNRQEWKSIVVFTKWITQCHHISMARIFESALNFPVYETNEDFLGESIVRTKNDKPMKTNEGFQSTVKLPPIEILLKESPENLISIRKEIGVVYINALRTWQANPNDNNSNKVQVLFEDYCSRICNYYDQHPPVDVKAKYGSGKNIGKQGFDFANNIISAVVPLAGMFISFSKLGYAVYEYFSDNKKYKPKERKLEININEKHKEI